MSPEMCVFLVSAIPWTGMILPENLSLANKGAILFVLIYGPVQTVVLFMIP